MRVSERPGGGPGGVEHPGRATCGHEVGGYSLRWAYPGPDGPLSTQRWEALREGIDDGRYLYTLEACIAEAKERGENRSAVAAGEALLAEIRNAVPVQAMYRQSGPWKGTEYALYRRRLADVILRFRLSSTLF